MPRSWLRWVCLLTMIAVLVAACGSDRDEDDTAAGGEDTETTEAPDEGGGDESFGELESPCGEGDAKGATDQGVTDTAITIGYGDDAGFSASPGLNHEMSDAMKALIKWCNEQGGINGRPIE